MDNWSDFNIEKPKYNIKVYVKLADGTIDTNELMFNDEWVEPFEVVEWSYQINSVLFDMLNNLDKLSSKYKP